MNIRTLAVSLVLLSPVAQGRAAAEDISSALRAFLRERVGVEHRDVGMVVGMVDERGSRVVGCGKLDNGTDQDVDGETVFEIGSITKTFTGLLLADMVGRGEMKLDDPVAKYLPASVKVPSFNGKAITLLHLATHTSGLPDAAGNLKPMRAENSRAEYSADDLYAFVSDYALKREPGTKYEYSTVGMALLGEAIARTAGASYESLVVDRICRPLGMNDTRIGLTPELRRRFATGHNYFGYTAWHTDWGSLAGGAALRSTAEDMLKYLAANLGLTPGPLASRIEATHAAYFHAHLDTETGYDTDIGLGWMITHSPEGAVIYQHGGLTRGFMTFACFDPARRRGVVVLCNSQDYDVGGIARVVLEGDWRSERRPAESRFASRIGASCVGQYRCSAKSAAGVRAQRDIGIRREGGRWFLQILGPRTWPVRTPLPPVDDELVPESETEAFERLSGVTIAFSRDAGGRVTGFSGNYLGHAFSYEKTSDQPPDAPEGLKPRVAVQVDGKVLEACAGRYEFGPDAAYPGGLKLVLWREADHLLGRASGENAIQGVFDVCPASETEFFVPVDGEQLTFTKDDAGEVTAVDQCFPGTKARVGRRMK